MAISKADRIAFDRATAFNRGFVALPGTDWTAIHYAPRSPLPPPHVQAAWPWRREIWAMYFVCRRSLGRGYDRHTTGEAARWSDAQRSLERLCHLTTALVAHNGMADRIAQLSNCFNVKPRPEKQVNFRGVFDQRPRSTLPFKQTWAKAKKLQASRDWRSTHALANEIKHRWIGDIFPQLPSPARIRREIDGKNVLYACFAPIEIKPEAVDEFCLSAQRSLNLLAGLASVLDDEIGWERYFHIVGR